MQRLSLSRAGIGVVVAAIVLGFGQVSFGGTTVDPGLIFTGGTITPTHDIDSDTAGLEATSDSVGTGNGSTYAIGAAPAIQQSTAESPLADPDPASTANAGLFQFGGPSAGLLFPTGFGVSQFDPQHSIGPSVLEMVITDATWFYPPNPVLGDQPNLALLPLMTFFLFGSNGGEIAFDAELSFTSGIDGGGSGPLATDRGTLRLSYFNETLGSFIAPLFTAGLPFQLAPDESLRINGTLTLGVDNDSSSSSVQFNPEGSGIGATAVPLPSAVWSGLALLAGITLTSVYRRRRAQA